MGDPACVADLSLGWEEGLVVPAPVLADSHTLSAAEEAITLRGRIQHLTSSLQDVEAEAVGASRARAQSYAEAVHEGRRELAAAAEEVRDA